MRLRFSALLVPAMLLSAAAEESSLSAPRASAPAVAEPRQLALVIGISDYRYFPDPGPPGMSKLHGPAESDVPRMIASLEKWGFVNSPDRMLVLTDGAATRAGIERGFEWLIRQVGSDSSAIVAIFYAGHGSWTPDRNGDERAIDPGDQWDEALVPSDTRADTAALHDPDQLVLDDQIQAWLKRLATPNVTMIVDACFSGTITRGGSVTPRGGAPPPAGPRSLRSGADSLNARHVLITAATAGQTAAERPFKTAAGERVFGVLTYYLSEALDAAPSTTSYADLMRDVRATITTRHGLEVTQQPQLDGDREAPLFRVRRAVAPQRPIRVAASSRDSVTLNAGALHGVRLSAIYDVFDSTETAFRGAPPYGQIEIGDVKLDRAVGRRAGSAQKPGGIPIGARAILTMVPPGIARLERINVHVAPGARDAARHVTALPWATLTDSTKADAVLARTATGVYQVLTNGRLILPLEEDTVGRARSIVGRDTGWAGSGDAICRALRRSFAIAAFRSIHNPSPPYLPVALRVVEGDTAPKGLGIAGKHDTAYVGRHYTLWARVQASAQSELYASAAVEGYVSPDVVFFPGDGGTTGVITPNEWTPILQGFDVTEPTGAEVIKLVVMADRPYSLASLQQSFPRCATPTSAARGIADGKGARDANRVTGWKALEHVVHILPDPSRR